MMGLDDGMEEIDLGWGRGCGRDGSPGSLFFVSLFGQFLTLRTLEKVKIHRRVCDV